MVNHTTIAYCIREVCLFAPRGSMLRTAVLVEAYVECFGDGILKGQLHYLDEGPWLLVDVLATVRETMTRHAKAHLESAGELGIAAFAVRE